MLDSEKDAPSEYHDKLTVAKTFALAIEAAAKLHPAAEQLIVHAALLAPEPIPLFLFAEGREELGEPLFSLLARDGLDEAVAALRAFALVDREIIADERDPTIETDTIRLHRLLREVIAARCTAGTIDNVRRALIRVVASVYPANFHSDRDSLTRARRLNTLALDFVGDATTLNGAAISASDLMNRLANYTCFAVAAYALAEALYEIALRINEKILGPDDHRVAMTLNNLAVLSRLQGDLDAALPLYERALAISEKVLGAEHPETASVLDNLGTLLMHQRKLSMARPLFERALAIRQKALGPEHPRTATSLNNLAMLLLERADLTTARPLFERALAIHGKVLGPEHPMTAMSLNNLGLLLADQGDLAAAHAEIRPRRRHQLLLADQGDLAAAQRLHERALAIDEKMLGSNHRSTATRLNNLAVVLARQDKFAAAFPLFERALSIRENLLGHNHPDTTQVRINLADSATAHAAQQTRQPARTKRIPRNAACPCGSGKKFKHCHGNS